MNPHGALHPNLLDGEVGAKPRGQVDRQQRSHVADSTPLDSATSRIERGPRPATPVAWQSSEGPRAHVSIVTAIA